MAAAVRRAIVVLGGVVLGGCLVASGSRSVGRDLAAVPDGALVAMCDHLGGREERPITVADSVLADEVFRRLRQGRLVRDRALVLPLLTRGQLQRVDGSDVGAAGAAGSEGTGRQGSGRQGSGRLGFGPLGIRGEEVTARGLHDLVSGDPDDSSWPNDGASVALRLALAYPDEVVAALVEGVRRGTDEVADVRLASWCARALVRMGCWRPELLAGTADAFPWYHLAGRFRGLNGAQWTACRAVLRGESSTELAAVDLRDRAIGTFAAKTGDRAGLPTNGYPSGVSDDAWHELARGSNVQVLLEIIEVQVAVGNDGLLPVHVVGKASPSQIGRLRELAPRSHAAAAALCEIGDAKVREDLFWGVVAGVPAAHHAMDGALGEVAWRSGCMVGLLEKALGHGGNWPFWAQFWIAEGSRSVTDLDARAFAQRLKAVLSSPDGVAIARSPFTGEWGLVPGPEGGG